MTIRIVLERIYLYCTCCNTRAVVVPNKDDFVID